MELGRKQIQSSDWMSHVSRCSVHAKRVLDRIGTESTDPVGTLSTKKVLSEPQITQLKQQI